MRSQTICGLTLVQRCEFFSVTKRKRNLILLVCIGVVKMILRKNC